MLVVFLKPVASFQKLKPETDRAPFTENLTKPPTYTLTNTLELLNSKVVLFSRVLVVLPVQKHFLEARSGQLRFDHLGSRLPTPHPEHKRLVPVFFKLSKQLVYEQEVSLQLPPCLRILYYYIMAPDQYYK